MLLKLLKGILNLIGFFIVLIFVGYFIFGLFVHFNIENYRVYAESIDTNLEYSLHFRIFIVLTVFAEIYNALIPIISILFMNAIVLLIFINKDYGFIKKIKNLKLVKMLILFVYYIFIFLVFSVVMYMLFLYFNSNDIYEFMNQLEESNIPLWLLFPIYGVAFVSEHDKEFLLYLLIPLSGYWGVNFVFILKYLFSGKRIT